ncbi:MAG: divalent-cation tolerance protein CutA [Verrucomicrobia bacterium]|nr:divalent-cation tolerance protein CutA [Verrucomicrobiota bacterium]
MKTARSFVTVWVTVPRRPLAVKLNRLSVESGLAACAQISGPVESGKEWRRVFKTQSRLLPKLEALVIANHPYDTPQFLVLPIVASSKKYLDWLGECVITPPKPTTRRRSKTH